MRRYDEITDRVAAGPLSAADRHTVAAALEEPSDDFKRLVEILDADGCSFPKTQAALMLRNTPGAAQKLLDENGARLEHVHDWQPRDDLSIESAGGGFWMVRTYQCSMCGDLQSVDAKL